MSYARRIAGDQFSSACVGRAGSASKAAAAPSWDDPFVRRFVYKIEPASLIPRDAEYIFESEEELKAGDILERVGRHLFVERVEDDDSNPETETTRSAERFTAASRSTLTRGRGRKTGRETRFEQPVGHAASPP